MSCFFVASNEDEIQKTAWETSKWWIDEVRVNKDERQIGSVDNSSYNSSEIQSVVKCLKLTEYFVPSIQDLVSFNLGDFL